MNFLVMKPLSVPLSEALKSLVRLPAKQIPEEIRNEYPQIQWRAIAGMRDHLIHGYFGIDYDIVWDVLQNHIPVLANTIDTILLRKDID
jgi:uncharacterized protein with HEPN domain